VDNDVQLGKQLRRLQSGEFRLLLLNLTKLEAIASYWPDVVLLDLCFDNSADSGLELLAELRTSHPNLPVLVFTDKEDFAN